MSYVGKITDTSGNTGLVGSTLYGTCSTGASTAAKVVTCADFDQLLIGVTIHVKFTNSNTASTPTLNVNSTGAKNIYKYGTTKPGTTAATSWYAGSVVSFTYDGSYWQMNDHIDDTNTQTVSSVAGKTGAVTLTNSDVGLGNVGNFKAVSTVASQGLTSTEQSNARANIGAGTSNLTIGTTSSTAMAGNTNVNKVTQTESTTDAEYEVVFAGSTGTTTTTEGVGKSQYFKFNPSKQAFTLGNRVYASTVGNYSIAEGRNVSARGSYSHAEGCHATASGDYSHAEGYSTYADGKYSHAAGNDTTANHKSQHTFGEYNIVDPSTAAATERGNYVEIVGNGTADDARSNARTLDWSGNEWLAGGLTLNNDEILIGDRYTGGNLNGTGLFINNYYDSDWDATYDLELEHRSIYQKEENSTSGFTNTTQIFPGIIQQELSLSGGSKVTSDIRPVSISLEAYSSSSSSSPDSKIFINSSDISLSGTNNSWDGTNASLKDAISSLNSSKIGKEVALTYLNGSPTGHARFKMSSTIYTFSSGSASIPFSTFGITKRPEVLILTCQSQKCAMQYDFDASSSAIKINLVGNSTSGAVRFCWICAQDW